MMVFKSTLVLLVSRWWLLWLKSDCIEVYEKNNSDVQLIFDTSKYILVTLMVSVTVVSSVTECSIMFNDNKVLKVLGWGHFLIDKPIWVYSVAQFLTEVQNQLQRLRYQWLKFTVLADSVSLPNSLLFDILCLTHTLKLAFIKLQKNLSVYDLVGRVRGRVFFLIHTYINFYSMNMHRLSEEAAFQGEKQIVHSFSWCPHTSLFFSVSSPQWHIV